MPKPNVLIYRDELLRSSETFILAQAEAFQDFTPLYVGLEAVRGLDVPVDRRFLLSRPSSNDTWARVRRARAKLLGPGAASVERLRAYRPALIHAHFGVDATHAMSLARALHIPLLVTFHGFDATVRDEVLRRSSFTTRRYVRRRTLLGERATRLVCVSEYIRRAVLAKGLPASKAVVHYIGVDVDQFTPDRRVQRSATVLFVGRLVPKKGCQYLLRAMKTVQARVPDAELVVIGDGPLRAELQLEANRLGIHSRFLGSQNPGTVRQWLNRARVFSGPSVVADSGDAEGFGMVFIEAQSMGLPVVSFASGGIPEAVEHGRTGLLTAPGDCDALAFNLIRLLTEAHTWETLSQAGQSRVREHFNLQKQSGKLEQLYWEVLHTESETRNSLRPERAEVVGRAPLALSANQMS